MTDSLREALNELARDWTTETGTYVVETDYDAGRSDGLAQAYEDAASSVRDLLANHPERPENEVKAEALVEAAAVIVLPGGDRPQVIVSAVDWLEKRAAHLRSGGVS